MKSRNNTNKTVYVGLSGGVDSSVAAALLKEQGYNVVGVYMKLLKEKTYGIPLTRGKVPFKRDKGVNEDLTTIKEICEQLDIPLKTYSLQEEFANTVVKKFIAEYKKGNTPNPCVYCNKRFKFGIFFDKAMADGADFVATGHYARIQNRGGKFILLRGKDKNKDQSYFLYNLNQEILSHTLFPIGNLEKNEVRKIAEELNLPTAKKEESQDVCFISNNDTQAFLETKINKSHGNIIDIDSKEIIGQHEGIAFYTIGQRRGVGIGGSDAPYFVVGKDINKNELYVGKGEDHPKLYKKCISLGNVHWISGEEPSLPLNCEVSIRYRQKPQKATIIQSPSDNLSAEEEDGDLGGFAKTAISFKIPVRAVSPGQSAVIYQGKLCLGGGIIEKGE